MKGPLGTRIWSYRDAPAVHLTVGALVCLFVLSPALFTPWGFGPDFTNHLWLVWQQGHAISNTGHPTLFLQQPGGVFEPFYGFYGGTLYAAVGAVSALFGNHAYPVYIASIGLAAAFAYGGMWWLGRQLGLSRWAAHLPGFVVVTAAYYLTDAYARGALDRAGRALGGADLPGRRRAPPQRSLEAGPGGALRARDDRADRQSQPHPAVERAGDRPGRGRRLDCSRPRPSRATPDRDDRRLDRCRGRCQRLVPRPRRAPQRRREGLGTERKLRRTCVSALLLLRQSRQRARPAALHPPQSTTHGLAIAAPVAAFALALVLVGLAWPRLGAVARGAKVLWLVVLATMLVLVGLMVMPSSWWISLGQPFTDIQFPYRLAGWLLVGVAVLLAISLRFARGLVGARRQVALILVAALVVATVAQAAAQMYEGARVDGHINHDYHPRTVAFANGVTTAPVTFYDPYSYADASLPQVRTEEKRTVVVPVPEAGATRTTWEQAVPAGKGPLPTNIAGGPYVLRVEGLETVGPYPRRRAGAEPTGERRGTGPDHARRRWRPAVRPSQRSSRSSACSGSSD